jgi:Sulfotransferase domain
LLGCHLRKQVLDFIVIGAQKCGTTTLFEYLVKHPQLCLPISKEAPFFNQETKYGGDWDRYLQTEFLSADPGCMWGTVTPQYMYGTSGRGRPADVRTTPRRMHERLPGVKLVAILRDPVERARSHHAMALLDDWDTRPFDEAVRQLLEPDALERARRQVEERTSYIVFGEYGRILQGFLDVYPREQLLVLFTKDLNDDPHSVMRQLFEFIGVDPDFVPENLGKHYHQSGSGTRMKWLDLYRWQMVASSAPALRVAWHGIPESARRRIDTRYRQMEYRVRLWNRRGWHRRTDDRDPKRDQETNQMLAEHFTADAALLSQLLDVTPPWEGRVGGKPLEVRG